MKKILNFTLKNTFVVFLVIVMLIGGGVYSAQKINMEAMPNITFPVVTTITVYPGASPEDVSEKITDPMQKNISSLQGVKSVKTINNENIGVVVTQFDYSQDMDKAEKEVTDAVNKVTLPDTAQKPTTSRISFGSAPIMAYAVSSNMDKEALTKYVNDKVNPKLSGVTGVSNISVQGTSDNTIYIKLKDDKLKDNGLTEDNVKSALTGNNISFPVGQADIDNKTLPIRAESKINSINELKSIPIVVPTNVSAVMGESLQKVGQGMTQLGSAVGQLGSGMGQLAEGMGQIGGMVGGNTQAIALLNVIQQVQMGILAQQGILTNPQSTPEQKMKAKQTLDQLQKTLAQTQEQLNKLLQEQAEKGKDLAASQGSKKSTSTSSGSSNVSASQGQATNTEIKAKVIFLSDIAEITTGSTNTEMKTRSNLKDGVILNVYKSDDANTVQVSSDIKDAVAQLHKDDSKVNFNLINDSSVSIKQSVNGMVREGVLGALFAIIVIAIFLRDFRATIIAVVSIPLSILIAIILLPKFGISLNIMSLGGIAVAVGRIVDDSIVVIENIYRRFSQADYRDDELIKTAAAEVGTAIVSSTITTVAVFLPLSFITGIVGKIFFSFAVTVVICILASLAVAITVVPTLSKKLLLNKKIKHVNKESKIVNGYRKVLSLALSHRIIVVLLSIVMLGGIVAAANKIPVQFLPSETTNTLTGKLTMAPGTSVEKTNEYALKFEKYLMDRKDIQTVASSVGDTSSSGSIMSMQGSNAANFTIVMKDGMDFDKISQEVIDEANKLSNSEGKFVVNTESFSGQSDKVEIDLYSDKVEDLSKASDIVMAKLKTFKELSNVTSSISEKKPEIEVKVDEAKAANNGLTSMMVAGSVSYALNSSKIMTIQNNGADTDVYLGYENTNYSNLDAIKNMQLTGMKGTIKLSDVADVALGYGPVSISSLDGKQYTSITADIKSKDTSKISKEAKAAVDSIKGQLPQNVTFSSGGSSEQINDAFSQMGLAMLIAVALVYVVMVLTFGEGKTPFAILFSLPFAAVGALLGLIVTGQSLSVSGLIGMLMLIGIVVTNAIVLLDRVRHNREDGMTVKEALVEAGGVRLRPILMTAIATIMALIPLALGFSEGALISQGLGIVVISGLLVSTLLTLIVVPVIYSILQRERV